MPSEDQNLRLSWQRLAWPGEGVGQANLLMVSIMLDLPHSGQDEPEQPLISLSLRCHDDLNCEYGAVSQDIHIQKVPKFLLVINPE